MTRFFFEKFKRFSGVRHLNTCVPYGVSLVFLLTTANVSGCRWFQPAPKVTPPPVTQPPLQIEEKEPEIPEKSVGIYFNRTLGTRTVARAVIRALPEVAEESPAPNVEKKITFVVKALLTGPTASEKKQGFFTEIPEKTQLLGVKALPDKIRVNVSKEFVSGGGSNSIQQRVSQLARTIRSVERTQPVYLDVDGQQLNILGGEGLEVAQPINKGNLPSEIAG